MFKQQRHTLKSHKKLSETTKLRVTVIDIVKKYDAILYNATF